MLIKIFIYLTLISQIFTLCGKGCLRCENNNCLICDSQQNYILRNNECLYQNLPHCLFSTKYDLCEICSEGYFLRRNRKCQQNPIYIIENCLFYNDLITCYICKSGYFLNFEGKCVEIKSVTTNCLYYKDAVKCDICTDGFLLDTKDNTCQKIVTIPNCLLYNNPFTCKKCINRYMLNKNAFLKNISDFYTQIVRNNELKLQKRLNSEFNLPFCERMVPIDFCKSHKNPFECQECLKGYYLTSSTKCSKNPVSNWTEKDSIVLNCFSFDSSNSCNMCYDGYYFLNHQCIKHSEVLENCFIRSQNKADSCFICNPNYYISPKPNELDKYICTIRSNNISFCEEYKIDEDKCSKCLEGFISHFNKTKCSKRLDECEVYNTASAVLTCSKCSDLYIPLNGTCKKNDNNCIRRDNDLCSRCKKGYSLNKEYICVVTSSDLLVHNCYRYDNTVENVVKCEDCKYNEIKITEKAYCVKGTTNCALFNKTGVCLQCKSGFHYSTPNCVANLANDNCELYKDLTANCLKCKNSYLLNYQKNCVAITKSSHVLDKEKAELHNCISTTQDHVCDICAAGFYPVKRGNINFVRPVTCQKRSENAALIENCLFFKNAKCLLCRNNFYLNIDSTGCIATCPASQILNVFKLQCVSNTGIAITNCLKTDGKACFECEIAHKPLLNYNYYNDSYFKLRTIYSIDTTNTSTTDDNLIQVDNCDGAGSGTYTNLYEDRNFRHVENRWGKYAKLKELRENNGSVTIIHSTLTECDTDKIYNFTQQDKFYKSIFSCHECTGGKILKLNLSNGYRITDVGFQDQAFLNSPNIDEIEKQTLQCLTPNTNLVKHRVNDCAVISYNVHKEMLDNANDSHDCVLCKPGYFPTYDDDDIISGCTAISQCGTKKTFNICDKCVAGYIFGWDKENQVVDKTQCILANSTHNDNENPKSSNCDIYSTDFKECIQCQPNYYYDYTNGCVLTTNNKKPTDCKSGLNGSHCSVCEDNGADQRVAIFNLNEAENECVSLLLLTPAMKARNCYIFNSDFTCFSCPMNYLIAPNGSCLNIETVAECIEGVVSNNSVVCTKCNIGYNLAVGGGACNLTSQVNLSKIPNCLLLESADSCGECKLGYSLLKKVNNNNICVRSPLPDGCLSKNDHEFQTNHELYCNSCEDKYTLQILTPATSESYCIKTSKISNCLIMNNNICQQCESSHYLNAEKTCVLRGTPTTNCVEYNKNSNACERTLKSVTPYSYTISYISLTNWNLLSTTEKLVLQKLPPHREGLGSGIPNCEVYKTSSTCKHCKNGYYKKDSKCEEIIQSKTNCLYYKTEQTCEICNENYMLVEEECEKIMAMNCKKIKDPKNCETCPDNYPVLTNDGHCVKPSGDQLNPYCEFFYLNPNDLWYCKECIDYHYPNDKGICVPINFPMANCLKYASFTSCLKCKNGYIFKEKSLTCEVAGSVEPNCDEFIAFNSCSVCDLGYFLENDICVLCKTGDSCNFCSPDNPEICLVCKSGFYMDNSGNCYKNT